MTLINFCFLNNFLILKDDSRTIKEHIDKGVLVPDDIVLKLLTEEIGKFAEKGFLLEGIFYWNDRWKLSETEEFHIQAIREHWIKQKTYIVKCGLVMFWVWMCHEKNYFND